MAGRKIDIEEKIQHQKEIVSKIKERYDEAVAQLEKLMTKRQEMQRKELMEAISKSNRSIEEILAFLQDSDENAPE